MSNPTGAFGLRPIRHLNGAPWNGATIPCYCSASYALALYVGDPILFSSTAAEFDATARYPTINKSAGTDGIIVAGAIVAFDPNPSNLEQQYRAASQERIAHVCVDQTVVYEIRGDGGGTPVDTWITANASMIATTAGSTVTGLSGMQLDEGTTTGPTANQSNPLWIVGASTRADETRLGNNTLWEVMLNTYFNATGLVLGTTGA